MSFKSLLNPAITVAEAETAFVPTGSKGGTTEGVLSQINKAQTGRWRLLMGGSSKTSFDHSANQVIAQNLKNIYGDAGTLTQSFYGLGGSYENPVNGWVKQKCEGPKLGRIRGDQTATGDLTFTLYGDTLEVAFTRESDSTSVNITAANVSGSTVIGTTPAAGAQQLGVVQTFNLGAVDYWTVTISKPTVAGYVYADYYIASNSTATGVEVLDFTMGGSALYNMMGNGSTEGLPVNVVAGKGLASPSNGRDAWLAVPNVDAYMFGWTFNDSGTDRYYPTSTAVNISGEDVSDWLSFFDGLIAAIGAIRRPVVYISEMAGHYLDLADSVHHGRWVNIDTHVRLAVGASNWLTVLDHNAPLAMDDYSTYTARYFTDGGTHETSVATAIQVANDAKVLGTPCPPTVSTDTLAYLRYKNLPKGGVVPASIAGVSTRSQCVGWATEGVASSMAIPVIADPDMANLRGAFGAATGTDQFGDWWGSNYNLYFYPKSTLTRITAKVLPDPSNGLVVVSADGGPSIVTSNGTSVSGNLATYVSKNCAEPVYVSWLVSGSGGYVTLRTGHFYEVWVTDSTTPMITGEYGWNTAKDAATYGKLAGTQTIPNGNFETGDLTGWTATGGTASVVTSGLAGAYRVSAGANVTMESAKFPVLDRDTVVPEVVLAPNSGSMTATVAVNLYNAAGTLVSTNTVYNNAAQTADGSGIYDGNICRGVFRVTDNTVRYATIAVTGSAAWYLHRVRLLTQPLDLDHVRAQQTAASAVSPVTDSVGVTAPVDHAIYDLVVRIATGGGGNDIAYCSARVYRNYSMLATEMIGTSHNSGTGDAPVITLSNPSSSGVIKATATWSGGVSRAVQFEYSLRLIATF